MKTSLYRQQPEQDQPAKSSIHSRLRRLERQKAKLEEQERKLKIIVDCEATYQAALTDDTAMSAEFVQLYELLLEMV